jgi:hypothetical protein
MYESISTVLPIIFLSAIGIFLVVFFLRKNKTSNIKCPKCNSNRCVNLDVDKYQCNVCNEIFYISRGCK